MLKNMFLCLVGGSYGLLAAAGVFTVFVAVGLVPRFAGRTHSANKVFLYEEMVIAGTLVGAWLSLFPETVGIVGYVQTQFPGGAVVWNGVGICVQAICGVFSGMFVGCLALAIAEMLDSIPIFARRIGFRHGIGLAVLGIATGKFCGAMLYFAKELHRVIQ